MGGVLAKVFFKSGEELLEPPTQANLADIKIMNIDGQMVRIGDYYKDKKVVMFVNVATK